MALAACANSEQLMIHFLKQWGIRSSFELVSPGGCWCESGYTGGT
jgi:hypothetical protein